MPVPRIAEHVRPDDWVMPLGSLCVMPLDVVTGCHALEFC